MDEINPVIVETRFKIVYKERGKKKNCISFESLKDANECYLNPIKYLGGNERSDYQFIKLIDMLLNITVKSYSKPYINDTTVISYIHPCYYILKQIENA